MRYGFDCDGGWKVSRVRSRREDFCVANMQRDASQGTRRPLSARHSAKGKINTQEGNGDMIHQ